MALTVQKTSMDNLRTSDAVTVTILVADLLRLHIDRIETSVVADLFALSDADISAAVGADLRAWAGRATREVIDLPEGDARRGFLAEVAAMPAELVSARFRAAIEGLAPTASAETMATLESLAATWAATPPAVLVLPTKPKSKVSAQVAAAEAAPRKVARAPKAGAAPKTPVADVDPRRGAFVRDDVRTTLEGKDPGIKENVLVAGIKHRSPFKDMTEAEIRAELRKLEREGLKQKPGTARIRKSGERWVIR